MQKINVNKTNSGDYTDYDSMKENRKHLSPPYDFTKNIDKYIGKDGEQNTISMETIEKYIKEEVPMSESLKRITREWKEMLFQHYRLENSKHFFIQVMVKESSNNKYEPIILGLDKEGKIWKFIENEHINRWVELSDNS